MYAEGTLVTINAIPNPGYILSKWMLDDMDAGSESSITVIMDADHNLTAVFVEVSPLIFADGFESGSFSAWTGTILTSGETASVVTSLPHHGMYGALFTTNGGGGTERASVYKNIDAQSEIYVRAYVYISSGLPLQNNDNRFNFIMIQGSTGAAIASVGVRRSGGADLWSIASIAGTFYASKGPIMGKWHCIEFYTLVNSTNGIHRLWIDGELVIERTGLNTAREGNINQARFGLTYVYGVPQSLSVYGDCFAISNEPIGPEG
jgi:hypothetical protein